MCSSAMKLAAFWPMRAALVVGPVVDLPPGVEAADLVEVDAGDDDGGVAVGGGDDVGEFGEEGVGAGGFLDFGYDRGVGAGGRLWKGGEACLRQSGSACGGLVIGTPEGVPFRGCGGGVGGGGLPVLGGGGGGEAFRGG